MRCSIRERENSVCGVRSADQVLRGKGDEILLGVKGTRPAEISATQPTYLPITGQVDHEPNVIVKSCPGRGLDRGHEVRAVVVCNGAVEAWIMRPILAISEPKQRLDSAVCCLQAGIQDCAHGER